MGHRPLKLAVLLLFACFFDGVKSQRTVPCPTGEQGYVSITAMNEDMQDELARIVAGGAAIPSYDFVLCPDTTFDGTVTLLPVLSQTRFICGAGGTSKTCIIAGGTQQVLIAESTVSTVPVTSVSFVDITFSGFNGTSISAFASNVTSAAFSGCTWTVSARKHVSLHLSPDNIEQLAHATNSFSSLNRIGIALLQSVLFIRQFLPSTMQDLACRFLS